MIEIDEYIITLSSVSDRYTLSEKKIVQKDGETKGNEYIRDIAYDIPMSRVMQTIIKRKIDEDKSINDLESYLDRYESISNEVLNKLDKVINKN